MNSLNVAILIVVVLILLYLFPATRGCLKKVAPWVALLGGGLAVGALLMAPDSSGAYTGGAAGKRRGKKAKRPRGKRGGDEHEALDDDEATVAELEAFLEEKGTGVVPDEEAADLTGDADGDGDEALGSLGAYVVDTPPDEEALGEGAEVESE